MNHDRHSPNGLFAEKFETQRQLQSLKETAGMVLERGGRLRRDQELSSILMLLSQHSLAKWQLILDELGAENSSVIENLLTLFTVEPLHNFLSRVFRLLKSFLHR